MGKEKKLREKVKKVVKSVGGVGLPLRGWLAGTPDYLLAINGKLTLIEFKAPGEDLSEIQKVMKARLAGVGVEVKVVRTIDEMEDILR